MKDEKGEGRTRAQGRRCRGKAGRRRRPDPPARRAAAGGVTMGGGGDDGITNGGGGGRAEGGDAGRADVAASPSVSSGVKHGRRDGPSLDGSVRGRGSGGAPMRTHRQRLRDARRDGKRRHRAHKHGGGDGEGGAAGAAEHGRVEVGNHKGEKEEERTGGGKERAGDGGGWRADAWLGVVHGRCEVAWRRLGRVLGRATVPWCGSGGRTKAARRHGREAAQSKGAA
uniref:Uncharacterized protein n=1 Tax=Oryza meridionalis TaxID=40149 RepID=A0A0E0EC24_9ORYZ